MTTVSAVASRPSVLRMLAAYVELTKPRIMLLVLMTGVPALLLANQGLPDPALGLGTLLGIALAAGSASAFNNFCDRDIDAVMRRTAVRALPSGLVSPSHALVFGFVLAGLAAATLAAFGNLLAAGLGMASIFYYAVV